MCKIGIGFRKNLCYPLMLIVCISIRKLDEIFMNSIYEYKNGFFISPLLIFTSQFFAGFIPALYKYVKGKKNSRKNNTYLGIKLIQNKLEITQHDNQIKIFILISFASFFNYVSTINRSEINPYHFENKIRSIQIVFSALLCYFTIRTKIYKHQLFSLIIIFIIILMILVIDYFFYKKPITLLESYGLGIFSCFSKAFLDTIEKYLFEFDYLDPYKVLMLEGLIGCLLLPFLLFLDETYEDIKNILENKHWELIIFLFIYFFLSSFKNIYKVLTIKFYSPMTRALAESIIDPFVFIYDSFKGKNKDVSMFYRIIILIFLLIASFLSLIYNDFIILYCCGLEYNTHLEIQKRTISYSNINGSIMDIEKTLSFSEKNSIEKTELSLQK